MENFDVETDIIETNESIQFSLQKLKEKVADGATIGIIGSNYRRLGMLNLFLKNPNLKETKYFFYKSIKIEELIFKIAKNQSSAIKVERPTMWGMMYKTVSYVLLADSVPLLYSFFELIDDVKGIEFRKGYHYNTAYALKHLILGNRQQAQRYVAIAQLPNIRKKAQNEIGYSEVIQGILDNDPALIAAGIDKSLKYHHRCDEGIFKAFCLEATAMTKLAQMYGFEIETTSPYIHKDLLKHDPSLVFEDIDEVYEALGFEKK